jgi:hypothetical protein
MGEPGRCFLDASGCHGRGRHRCRKRLLGLNGGQVSWIALLNSGRCAAALTEIGDGPVNILRTKTVEQASPSTG